MFYFPGATILKSHDLVNWEYCANPLQKIAESEPFNLQNGYNQYSKGQWAPSLKYYQGKFYLHFIAFNHEKFADGGDWIAFRKAGHPSRGLVQTQTGEWWTILFKDAGTIGRIPYLEPVVWKDGWPILGNNGIDVSKGGKSYKKPNVGKEYPKHTCQPMMVSTPTSLGCSGNGTTILTIRHGL